MFECGGGVFGDGGEGGDFARVADGEIGADAEAGVGGFKGAPDEVVEGGGGHLGIIAGEWQRGGDETGVGAVGWRRETGKNGLRGGGHHADMGRSGAAPVHLPVGTGGEMWVGGHNWFEGGSLLVLSRLGLRVAGRLQT